MILQKSMKRIFYSLFLFCSIFSSVNAQALKRKYSNGFRYKMVTIEIKKEKSFTGEYGILVDGVLPNSTSESAGIKQGDIIVEINGTIISDVSTFTKSPLSEITEGTAIEYKVWRNSAFVQLNTTAKAKASKTKQGISYEYGEIKTSFGYLRTLVSKPVNASGKLPAILFIQGNMCESVIEVTEKDPYEQFCNEMTLLGYAVMRIDKPGAGDSEGKVTTCNQMTFNQELEQFQTGFESLVKNNTIESTKIYLFGHSMGGMIAPILASNNPSVKGAMVYGTLTTNFGSYYPEIVSRSLLQSGNSPEVALEYKNYTKEVTTALFYQNKTPQQIISDKPEYESVLQQVLGWNEKDNTILFRSLAFNRELNMIYPKKYWEKVTCPILSIYGTSDFEAMDKDYATAMLGWTNPKNAKHSKAIILEDTDHAFALVGSMEEGIKLKLSGNYSQIMQDKFNPLLVTKTVEWLSSF
jgi:pimeloyl-ACP methyl ester carboxylesterase